MENTTIAEIAKKLNVSTAMVSRVLRHCSGVDSEMRQRIFAEADRLPRPDYGECAVYTILPDVPRYFWHPLKQSVNDTLKRAGIPYKINICTQAGDESTVLRYLDEAERLQAKAIILASRITVPIHQRLTELADRRLLALVSTNRDLDNAFYVGSNAYQDGAAMGRYYVQHFADRVLILFDLPDNFTAAQRLAGFLDTLRTADPALADSAVHIKLDQQLFKNLKLLPSKLASLIIDAAPRQEQLCIYSPTGIPQFPLALVKAKLTEQVVCLCHDYYIKEKQPSGNVALITCNQDCSQMGRLAAELASAFVTQGFYPEQKMNYISSAVHELTT